MPCVWCAVKNQPLGLFPDRRKALHPDASDVTEEAALVPALHALRILVNAHAAIVLIDENRYMPPGIRVLVDQHLHRHCCQGSVERLDGWLLDILPAHIAPLDQRVANPRIGMSLAGDLDRIDAVEALQAQVIAHPG